MTNQDEEAVALRERIAMQVLRCTVHKGDEWETADRIMELLARTPPASDVAWQPIETAPMKTPVIVYVPRRLGALVALATNSTGTQWWARNLGDLKPTHWMEFSEPERSPYSLTSQQQPSVQGPEPPIEPWGSFFGSHPTEWKPAPAPPSTPEQET